MAGDMANVSGRDWLVLMEAVETTDCPEARAALARLMRRYGVTPSEIGRRAEIDEPSEFCEVGAERADIDPAPESRDQTALAVPSIPSVDDPIGIEEPAPDDGLDFDALAEGADDARWELVGPLIDLAYASRAAGLDANAVRLTLDDMDPEATLIHPSPFCQDPAVFLGVLAVLARTTPHVRLYRVRRRDDGPASVLVRVFPHPGEETLALLDAFHPDVADRVRDATLMVADALAHLDGQAPMGSPTVAQADQATAPDQGSNGWSAARAMGDDGDGVLDFGDHKSTG